MKHRVAMRKLGRDSAHRWSMLRTMVSQLVRHERIETTLPKAKELRRLADHVVTLGKEGTLYARRKAAAIVRGDDVMAKLFGELPARYAAREGGYSRVLRSHQRHKEAAQMAYIEYVDRPGELRPARPPRLRLGAGAAAGGEASASPYLPAAAQAALGISRPRPPPTGRPPSL